MNAYLVGIILVTPRKARCRFSSTGLFWEATWFIIVYGQPCHCLKLLESSMFFKTIHRDCLHTHLRPFQRGILLCHCEHRALDQQLFATEFTRSPQSVQYKKEMRMNIMWHEFQSSFSSAFILQPHFIAAIKYPVYHTRISTFFFSLL